MSTIETRAPRPGLPGMDTLLLDLVIAQVNRVIRVLELLEELGRA